MSTGGDVVPVVMSGGVARGRAAVGRRDAAVVAHAADAAADTAGRRHRDRRGDLTMGHDL
jgi:hypothetical protein